MDPQNERDDRLKTRVSLLNRLHDPADIDGWNRFVSIYRKLIFTIAKEERCTNDEADEVVQRILIHVAKQIHRFEYDPAGSFKAWLVQATRWRARDQIRRRPRANPEGTTGSDRTRRTTAIERIPAPSKYGHESQASLQHHQYLLRKALTNVQRQVSARHFQVYNAHVVQEMPVDEVTKTFGMSAANVHQIKSRISRMLQTELKLLGVEKT